MCQIPERKNVTKIENIFMLDRAGRQLQNWQELCALPEMSKYDIRTKCFENLNFCDQVKHLNWGDILLAPHGSGIGLATFARYAKIAKKINFCAEKGVSLLTLYQKNSEILI
jgi:hypothetical protein